MWDLLFVSRQMIAEHIRQGTHASVAESLNRRGQGPRHQANDNGVFAALNAGFAYAFRTRDYALAVKLFEECYPLALKYEEAAECEVHKGAMTFNAGVAYLALNDFTSAMRYFELAEQETRATEKEAHPDKEPSVFDIYTFGLFKEAFWEPIDAQAERHPVQEYKLLWGNDFGTSSALQDWSSLTRNSKLLYIISLAQRMRHLELAKRTSWEEANSLYLAHWNLAADLARLLENEMKEQLRNKGLDPGGTLGDVINQYCGNPADKGTKPGLPPSDVADWANLYKAANSNASAHPGWRSVSDTAAFNSEFPLLKQNIEALVTSPAARIANSIRLLNAARNQVAHKVDDAMVLFTDPAASVFTVNVLISLCHVDAWAN